MRSSARLSRTCRRMWLRALRRDGEYPWRECEHGVLGEAWHEANKYLMNFPFERLCDKEWLHDPEQVLGEVCHRDQWFLEFGNHEQGLWDHELAMDGSALEVRQPGFGDCDALHEDQQHQPPQRWAEQCHGELSLGVAIYMPGSMALWWLLPPHSSFRYLQ